MIEKEFKILLDENDYYRIKELCTGRKSESKIQTNHYFDTESFFFDKKNVTLRVRETCNEYVLTVKIKDAKLYDEKIRVSDEYKFKISYTKFKGLTEKGDDICEIEPGLAQVFESWREQFSKARYLGKLTTDRTKLKPRDKVPYIELDKNEFLGCTDWELECEVESQEEIEAFEEWLKAENILPGKPVRGKYGRFLDRLKSTNDIKLWR
ncbi:MAG: CYTH domain-containing protein [Bacillota bacterium]